MQLDAGNADRAFAQAGHDLSRIGLSLAELLEVDDEATVVQRRRRADPAVDVGHVRIGRHDLHQFELPLGHRRRRDVGGGFARAEDLPRVLLWEESLGDEPEKNHCGSQHGQGHRERDRGMPQYLGQGPVVRASDRVKGAFRRRREPSRMPPMVEVQEHAAHHRRDHQRHHRGHQQGHADRDRELAEQAAHHAAHEQERDQGGNQ